jgi:hypothetical protein
MGLGLDSAGRRPRSRSSIRENVCSTTASDTGAVRGCWRCAWGVNAVACLGSGGGVAPGVRNPEECGGGVLDDVSGTTRLDEGEESFDPPPVCLLAARNVRYEFVETREGVACCRRPIGRNGLLRRGDTDFCAGRGLLTPSSASTTSNCSPTDIALMSSSRSEWHLFDLVAKDPGYRVSY